MFLRIGQEEVTLIAILVSLENNFRCYSNYNLARDIMLVLHHKLPTCLLMEQNYTVLQRSAIRPLVFPFS